MNRDCLFLADILKACDRIAEYIRDGEEAYRGDPRTQDAVLRNLEILGEATKQLSEELKVRANDVPWRQISGMRDKLIHHYFGVDLDLVWHTASSVVPAFRKRAAELLGHAPDSP